MCWYRLVLVGANQQNYIQFSPINWLVGFASQQLAWCFTNKSTNKSTAFTNGHQQFWLVGGFGFTERTWFAQGTVTDVDPNPLSFERALMKPRAVQCLQLPFHALRFSQNSQPSRKKTHDDDDNDEEDDSGDR